MPYYADVFLSGYTHMVVEGLCLAITSSDFRTALSPYKEKLHSYQSKPDNTPPLPIQNKDGSESSVSFLLSHIYPIQARYKLSIKQN